MSSFSTFFRAAVLTVSLAGAMALSGCTGLTPVYGDKGAAQALSLNFAAPNNPLEQIVYQDLARRFGMSDNPDAPQVSVAVSAASRDLAQSVTTDPAKGALLTASGVLRITRNGQAVLTTTRQATATYSYDSQVLADNSAATAAGEQAAHALADTLELTIMSALTPTAPGAMTALKAHEIGRYLARPDLREGVFLAYGPDGGLVRETAQKLCGFLAGGSDPGEIFVFEGAELDADSGRLAMEARTDSLFGGRRVLRVRNAGRGLVLVLADFVAVPDGAAIVLEAGNLTPRDPLRALVEAGKFGRTLPCYPDSEETLLRLIAETFAQAGIAADPDVAETLRDQLGNDREITRRELEKLVLYAAASKRLTRADILVLCADNGALVTDEIADAATTGRAVQLDEALARALSLAINPQQLLASAAYHVAALRRWRGEVDAGRSIRDVLDGSRPKPHFSRRAALEQQLRLWSDSSLALAGARLQSAMAQSRLRPVLAEPILRRTLLALSRMAAEH